MSIVRATAVALVIACITLPAKAAVASDAVTNFMRVVTFNLRYDSKPDNLTVQDSLNALLDPLVEPKYFGTFEEKPWSTRRIRIAHELLSSGIDIACAFLRLARFCMYLRCRVQVFKKRLPGK